MREGCYYLKVKIKSLVEEARIIRTLMAKNRKDFRNKEELQHLNFSLSQHKRTIIKSETRAALLAYGFLRGRPFARMEPHTKEVEDAVFARVERLVKKYGMLDFGTGHRVYWNTPAEDRAARYTKYQEEKNAADKKLLEDLKDWFWEAGDHMRANCGVPPIEREPEPVQEVKVIPCSVQKPAVQSVESVSIFRTIKEMFL